MAFKKILLVFSILICSQSSMAWLFVQGAPSCEDWAAPKKTFVTGFQPRTDSSGNWMLVCRGEPKMFFNLQTGTTSLPYWSAHVLKAGRSAGLRGENLNPGECAWPDRAMGPTEGAILTTQALCNPRVTLAPVNRNDSVGLPSEPIWTVQVTQGALGFLTDSNRRFGIFVKPTGDSTMNVVLDSSQSILILK